LASAMDALNSAGLGLRERARAFAEPLIAHETFDTGENALAHADAVAAIVQEVGADAALQAASYLVYACEHLAKPQEALAKAFGESEAHLALETLRLVKVQRQARLAQLSTQVSPGAATQTENIRKMLLAFSRDVRVVLLRLASRLQTLRYYAATKAPVPQAIAVEALHVFAPLANRLGIWQIKWEMEDLCLRFLEPEVYKTVAKQLQSKRVEREQGMSALRESLQQDLLRHGVKAQVQARPKHIYSIVKKMRGKNLSFEQVLDVRAMRVVTQELPECYTALARVHDLFTPIAGEFDDYIAKPKANGYQSLHTVVKDSSGQPLEIQIRTEQMHRLAETGVAAHWAYKEAGSKGYEGVSASGAYDAKIAVLRELLAWKNDLSGDLAGQAARVLDDRIYVLTPEAAIVDLPQGATPVDFAYAVHTNLGHRCRGARVNAQMVPLNTPLINGQTVDIMAAKEGGPSRDWLNPELHFLTSPRAKAKVRAWFNALHLEETVARGRELVEKLLQREGKTALKHADLAAQLGFKTADDLFEVVGKDEYSVRTIEQYLRPASESAPEADAPKKKASESAPQRSGSVLVVGVDSLLTQLAKCCKPAPPDSITGYVTRGKGVSVHRDTCTALKSLLEKDALQNQHREVALEWGKTSLHASYEVDLRITAQDRAGVLRDVTDVFSKAKIPVRAVAQTQLKGRLGQTINLTVQMNGVGGLRELVALISQVKGVERVVRL
jgi:GTP pyrophosphokinase